MRYRAGRRGRQECLPSWPVDAGGVYPDQDRRERPVFLGRKTARLCGVPRRGKLEETMGYDPRLGVVIRVEPHVFCGQVGRPKPAPGATFAQLKLDRRIAAVADRVGDDFGVEIDGRSPLI